MTDAPHPHADALKYEDWAGEMGAPSCWNRTVSWQISTPCSNSRSSTLRRLSGKWMYSITAIRITSGEELKQRNGLPFRSERCVIRPCHPAATAPSRLV